jgi:hypothetical protein
MKKHSLLKISSIAVIPALLLISILFSSSIENNSVGKFPYKKAGLTEKQAAAHLVSRFTYGATPNLVNEVAEIGVEKWFIQQLEAKLADDSLQQMLVGYDALTMSNEQIVTNFPRVFQVLRI